MEAAHFDFYWKPEKEQRGVSWYKPTNKAKGFSHRDELILMVLWGQMLNLGSLSVHVGENTEVKLKKVKAIEFGIANMFS